MTPWQSFYESIQLTEDELKEAILQGKIKKYFREKHKAYWDELEHGVSTVRKSKGGKSGNDVVCLVRGSDPESVKDESPGNRSADSKGVGEAKQAVNTVCEDPAKVPAQKVVRLSR